MTMPVQPKQKGKRREKKTLQAAPGSATVAAPKAIPDAAPKTVPNTIADRNPLSLHGITLNPEEARKAIILAEIIGPPAAKKRRRR